MNPSGSLSARTDSSWPVQHDVLYVLVIPVSSVFVVDLKCWTVPVKEASPLTWTSLTHMCQGVLEGDQVMYLTTAKCRKENVDNRGRSDW